MFSLHESQKPISDIKNPKEASVRLDAEIQNAKNNSLEMLNRPELIQKTTELIRLCSRVENSQASSIFRENEFLKSLNLGNKYAILNRLDRDIHQKIIKYLDESGVLFTLEQKSQIIDYFNKLDIEKRYGVINSYAKHGILTLWSALNEGLTIETSATPGDFMSIEEFDDKKDDSNIRGYAISGDQKNDDLFYGRNSFFNVVLERGGENINNAGRLPKVEVENRLRNSMIFVVKADKLKMSPQNENTHREDIVLHDILPEDIDYLVIDKSNALLAREAFKDLPVKIVEVDRTSSDIHMLFDGPYELPDYQRAINEISNREGQMWCHIARLPVDTYPQN